MDVIPVPASIREVIAGRPDVGEWDPVFPFLTVDESGFPHVCLLGRAELDTDGVYLRVVLAGSTTIANARRSGKATLIVIGAKSATYCKLELARHSIHKGPLEGFVFRVASIKRDDAGVSLQGPRFLVAEDITISERWTAVAELLSQLQHQQ